MGAHQAGSLEDLVGGQCIQDLQMFLGLGLARPALRRLVILDEPPLLIHAAYCLLDETLVAYALAGSVTIEVTREAIGTSSDGHAVYLRDIWPTSEEIAAAVAGAYEPEIFRSKYADLFDGGEAWDSLDGASSQRFQWQASSTYIGRPPYFEGLSRTPAAIQDIRGIRPLVILGDSVTTDHISPSGAISLGTPAADFLLAKGVQKADFNHYTTRRGNHEPCGRPLGTSGCATAWFRGWKAA
jgi:aconitate hydratase